MNRGGFSWKRFTGISAAKSRLSRAIGVPLTKGGRERKIGRMVTGGGCLVVLVAGPCVGGVVALLAALAL